MRKSVLLFGLMVVVGGLPTGSLAAQEVEKSEATTAAEDEKGAEKKLPSIEVKAADWQAVDGFQPYFWDADHAKIWLKIEDWDREFLFVQGLGTGLGSNPVGLDRGQLGTQLVCRFQRVGKKVLLVARNLRYRALSDNPVERRAVRESFAESVLWGGKVAAATGESVVVDLTSLLTSDLHGVAGKLRAAEQGDYSLDPDRCGIYVDRCKSFPRNTEMEALLTFVGSKPGRQVAQVTPSPKNITLRQHVSFVELPDAGYQPRRHHPACASMFVSFSDYAAPLDAPLQKRWIVRHRLVKRDPAAPLSEPVEPVIYYVDPGAPQLIREALVEGASWWNEAFEAAGFRNAFQVRVLPDDADPMDVRYNVIQWVHRSTRGWSYGGSVVDPRTGEIIKGHVTLGSLRVRQDRLLFEALGPGRGNDAAAGPPADLGCCGAFGVTGDTVLAALGNREIDPVEVALARIRQLSAHEVGHTLGFVHNFAASTYDDRASVMDYPAPRVKIIDGKLDLAGAYGSGIGTWDKWSVDYAYRQFDEGTDEHQQLEQRVREARERGMVFVSDADARSPGAAHPLGNLWDNGTHPAEELKHVMRVRKIALSQLGPEHLSAGEALGHLQQMFVPVYLYHRYQVDATAKLIGGVEYTYATAGQDAPMKVVPATQQLQALQALLATLDPRQLVIDDRLWKFMPPTPFPSHRDIELFRGRTGPVFDREAAARVAADMTIGNLLQPQRVSRLAMTFQTSEAFGPRRLMVNLIDYVWRQPLEPEQVASVSRVVKQSLTDHMLKLSAHPDASVAAKTAARFGIDRIRQYLDSARRTGGISERHFVAGMLDQIRRFETRPYPQVNLPAPVPVPPGSPIGQ